MIRNATFETVQLHLTSVCNIAIASHVLQSQGQPVPQGWLRSHGGDGLHLVPIMAITTRAPTVTSCLHYLKGSTLTKQLL